MVNFSIRGTAAAVLQLQCGGVPEFCVAIAYGT